MRRLFVTPLLLIFVLSACSELAAPPAEHGFLGQPIYGGEAPAQDDHRFDAVVGLIVDGYYCSGTLISPDYVLTAGHCVVTGRKRIRVLSPSQVQVYFSDIISGSGASVSEVILHSGYDHNGYGVNDIALLRLTNSSSVSPMAWLPSGMANLETVDTPVFFAGYGRTEYGTIGRKLFVDGSISAVQTYQLRNEQDDFTGTCGGDSGGPLIYDFGSTFYVGGTTSWGDNNCTDYGWSMRVSAFDSWISGYVGPVDPVDPECSVSAECDDSDACTTDACVSGFCENDEIYCDDGNDCTDDSCDSVEGCVGVNDDTNSCNAGDDCTANDSCVSGVCNGGNDSTDSACMCLPKRASCSSNSDCCSNRCHRNTCR